MSVGNYLWPHRVRHQWVSEPRPPWEADSTRLDAKSEENSTNFSKIFIFSKTHRFIRDKRRSDGLEFWQMSFFQKLFGGSKQKKRTYDNIKDRIFENFRQVKYFKNLIIYLLIQKWLLLLRLDLNCLIKNSLPIPWGAFWTLPFPLTIDLGYSSNLRIQKSILFYFLWKI